MTKEEINKIKKVMVDERNSWARDCDRRAEEEHGKIIGADYMLQRFLECISEKEMKSVWLEDKEIENIENYSHAEAIKNIVVALRTIEDPLSALTAVAYNLESIIKAPISTRSIGNLKRQIRQEAAGEKETK